MAFTMVHIYIASKVAEHLEGIKDYSTYILGSIAPDAVHASDTYTVMDKERSHLFAEGLHKGKISNTNQVNAWINSIRQFYEDNKNMCNFDFLLGYIVHLYTDVYNGLKFYYPYLHSIGGELAGENREHFLRESFGYNYYLYLDYSKNNSLGVILETAIPETFEGVIDKNLIRKRVESLFEQEFSTKDISDIDGYTICNHETMDKLIDDGSNYVLDELKILGIE
ncbi:MAG: zinc dependent phospholipase C family protein [Lachnospiraceae bacterium]|nr:zinc dependent phospholipase C family protein [Lachnospiraceae bacterium]